MRFPFPRKLLSLPYRRVAVLVKQIVKHSVLMTGELAHHATANTCVNVLNSEPLQLLDRAWFELEAGLGLIDQAHHFVELEQAISGFR